MIDLSIQQFVVKVAVDGQKEVVYAAIEGDGQFPVLKAVHGGDDRVLFPVAPAAGAVAKVLLQSPVVLEGAEVNAAAGCTGCAKDVFVADTQVKSAVTSHT